MTAAAAPGGTVACYDKGADQATLSAFPAGGHTLAMSWELGACAGASNDRGMPRTFAITLPLASATLSALWLFSLRPRPRRPWQTGRMAVAALLLGASVFAFLAVIAAVDPAAQISQPGA
jgi:hypothetical protein